MSRSPDALEASYAACRQLARRSRSNFYPCFFLLRRAQRTAMEAIYAFMRYTDDLADGSAPIPERREALMAWHRAVIDALATIGPETVPITETLGWAKRSAGPPGSTGGPALRLAHPTLTASHAPDLSISQSQSPCEAGLFLLPALTDTRKRFGIPAEHFLAVIEGVEMDLDGRVFRTFADLTQYCDRVASAVGLACLYVWGFHGDEALPAARCCGWAFQLTNILRDLKEDAARGRIYLPREDMDACAYSPENLARGVADERFDRLMAMQIERARLFYRQGADLFTSIEPPGRRIFGMMIQTYWSLLEKIASEPRRVLEGRVRLSRWKKLRIGARWTLLPARRSALP